MTLVTVVSVDNQPLYVKQQIYSFLRSE